MVLWLFALMISSILLKESPAILVIMSQKTYPCDLVCSATSIAGKFGIVHPRYRKHQNCTPNISVAWYKLSTVGCNKYMLSHFLDFCIHFNPLNFSALWQTIQCHIYFNANLYFNISIVWKRISRLPSTSEADF